MSYPKAFIDFVATIKGSMTALRKEVLYILWLNEKPLKAYEILDRLLVAQPHAAPTSVYRVLDFFLKQGIIHKLDSLQSYALCTEPHRHHVAHSEVMMICHVCRMVVEVCDEDVHRNLMALVSRVGFQWEEGLIELKGICKNCSLASGS